MEDNKNEEQFEKIVFESEDGKDEFYVLEQTMLGGVNYILVTEDIEDEEAGCLVLKEIPDDEEEYVSYEIVDDDKVLESVLPIFDELLEDIDLEV